jgi:hypothetical protein
MDKFDIPTGLAQIKERIVQAAQRAGRDPSRVRVVAVSKFVAPERIEEAIKAGITVLGENRVQEFLDKHKVIKEPVDWHLVGTLQTNKVKPVIGKVEMIHSLDRLSLAEEISRQTCLAGSSVKVLVQVNVSGEPSKRGIEPQKVIYFLEQIAQLEGLSVKGLMTIAPFGNVETARVVFRELRVLFDQVAGLNIPNVKMQYLSMGMTDDFEIAVEEGSNLVRIGTGIFGKREVFEKEG